MLPWLTGPWVIDGIAGAVLLLGLAAAAWGLWGDRNKGVPRCPRCWYDLRGQPAERRLACPECGHTAHHERRLYRNHRHWWPIILGLALFVLPSAGVLYVVTGWQREQAALAAIRAHHPDNPGIYSLRSAWTGPAWLRAHVPASLQRYGERVVALGVGSGDDADMAHLSGLVELKDLAGMWHVTDAGLVHLTRLRNLESLSLESTDVTGAGLAHLSGLTKLRCLLLGFSEVTDAGLAHLPPLASLTQLDLRDTRVTDAGLAPLSGLANLEELGLMDVDVTDAGLAPLSRLTKLKRLHLPLTTLSDAGLAHLAGLSNLEEIDTTIRMMPDFVLVEQVRKMHQDPAEEQALRDRSMRVTEAGAADLARLKKLKVLKIPLHAVNDDALRYLSGLAELEMLDLAVSDVTDAGLAHLAGLKKLEVLRLGGNPVTDAGLVHLYGCKALVEVDLYGTNVTREGVAELQKHLPNAMVLP